MLASKPRPKHWPRKRRDKLPLRVFQDAQSIVLFAQSIVQDCSIDCSASRWFNKRAKVPPVKRRAKWTKT
jgi:hypothetical protein